MLKKKRFCYKKFEYFKKQSLKKRIYKQVFKNSQVCTFVINLKQFVSTTRQEIAQ